MSNYSNAVLADNPIRYYRLDESSGPTAFDSSGNGYDGTYGGLNITYSQTGLITSDLDKAVKFDEYYGYVSLPTTGLPTGASPFSIECWIKPTSSSFGNNFPTPISYGTRHNNHEILFWCDSDQHVYFQVGDGLYLDGGVLSISKHHLLGTYDGSFVSFYIDGVLINSGNSTPNVIFSGPQSGAYISLDVDPGFGSFPGVIDEVAFYNYALTQTQVSNHYSAGTAPFSLGSLARSKFFTRTNERTGARARFITEWLLSTKSRSTFKIYYVPNWLTSFNITRNALSSTFNTSVHPNSTVRSAMILTDDSGNLVSAVSSVSVKVTFPDNTTNTYSPVTIGSGKYLVSYASKDFGMMREEWSVVTIDGFTGDFLNIVPVNF